MMRDRNSGLMRQKYIDISSKKYMDKNKIYR